MLSEFWKLKFDMVISVWNKNNTNEIIDVGSYNDFKMRQLFKEK